MKNRSSSLYEGFSNNISDDKVSQATVKGSRGARLTIDHLLKLREIRENRKLRRLKDLKLYTIMYSQDDSESSGF